MEFQGFQNSLPPFLTAFIAILLIVIAFLSYRKLLAIPTVPRFGLILLRSTAFILVLLLFLNPYFFSSESIEKKSRLLFLLDNSESLAITKGTYSGIEAYREVVESLNLETNSELEIEYFTIGSTTRQLISPDSLNFLEGETNFSNAISQVLELEDDFDASIILSDGIITYGRNPIIQADNLSIPLYTISLGDTSIVKDVAINNIVFNPNGFTNTLHSVEIEIQQSGFDSENLDIELTNSLGEILDSKNISFDVGQSSISSTFEIALDTKGLQQFFVNVEELNGEWTFENNSSPFTINVSDSKIRITHLAFEIHPDVKTLRSLLSEDENIELSNHTWLAGNRFIESNEVDLESADLVIFHGLPSTEFNTGSLESYSDKPTLYFHLLKSRQNRFNLFPEISLLNNSGNRLFDVSLIPSKENEGHPILELPEIGYQTISPLISSLRSTSDNPGSIDLFKSSFQNIETPNTLISITEIGNVRRASISAWGWYRMYQSPDEAEREFVSQLFTNLVNWTSNDPDDRRMKISPSKPLFNVSEEVIINASLNNESGELESDAIIEVDIQSISEESQIFNMQNKGDGNYQLSINSFSSGLYNYTATARKGDRIIDTQNGEFLIENSNSELVNTIRNDQLMRSLATETGGKHFNYNELNDFWNTLNSDEILDKKEEVLETYIFPVRSVFWFALVLLLLATEWLFRKRYSLP